MQEDLVKLARTASGVDELAAVSDRGTASDVENKEVLQTALLIASSRQWTICFQEAGKSHMLSGLCVRF